LSVNCEPIKGDFTRVIAASCGLGEDVGVFMVAFSASTADFYRI
jgi:hypothetical protein